jgi:hypothetical protein
LYRTWIGLCLLITLTRPALSQSNQKLASLKQELTRLKLKEAVVVPYNGLYDTEPRWSPKSDAIAFKIAGKWQLVDLNKLHLTKTKWHHGASVGIIDSEESYSEISEDKIKNFKSFTLKDPRKITLKNGTVIELRNQDMSTILLVKQKGKKVETWWQTGMENCYLPVPSPDERYVGYISELNGIAVMLAPGPSR